VTRGLGPEQLQQLRDIFETMRKNLGKPVNTDKVGAAEDGQTPLVSPVLTGDVPA
jgi:hypothetical protein